MRIRNVLLHVFAFSFLSLALAVAQTGPTITAQPQSQEVAVGARVTFSVTATAAGAISYQWKKASMPIDGATASTYVIASAGLDSWGEYSVDVTSGGITVRSAYANLKVFVPPVINAQSSAVYTALGALFTVEVRAEGTNLNYSWKKDGVALPGVTTPYYIATSSTASTGVYECTVSNSAGSVTSQPMQVYAFDPDAATRITPPQQFADPGATVTLAAPVVGGGGLTYEWYHDSAVIEGARSNTLRLANVSSRDSGEYWVLIGWNGAQVGLSRETAKVEVREAPAILSQPPSIQLQVGERGRYFLVNVGGAGPFTYEWKKDGASLGADPRFTVQSGSNYTYLNFGPASEEMTGSYTLTVTNKYGSHVSAPAAVTVRSTPGLPLILTQPLGLSVASGGTARFSVAIRSTSAPVTYQWYKDGVPVPGATESTLVLAGVNESDAGTYTVVVTNPVGGVPSAAAQLQILSGARLMNLSARADVGKAGNVLIAGFVLRGTSEKTILLRATGPGLAFGFVQQYLQDPVLQLFGEHSRLLAKNDDWGKDNNLAALAQAEEQAGVSPFPTGSKDAALVARLMPGAYTAQVSGANDTTGVALVEVFEVGPSETRLLNISARAQVGVGEKALIGGLIVRGQAKKRFLVRALGPGLRAQGVTENLLADPKFDIMDADHQVVAANDNWSSDPAKATELAQAAVQLGATALEARSPDAAAIVELSDGGYTVMVSSADPARGGVALIEITELP